MIKLPRDNPEVAAICRDVLKKHAGPSASDLVDSMSDDAVIKDAERLLESILTGATRMIEQIVKAFSSLIPHIARAAEILAAAQEAEKAKEKKG